MIDAPLDGASVFLQVIRSQYRACILAILGRLVEPLRYGSSIQWIKVLIRELPGKMPSKEALSEDKVESR